MVEPANGRRYVLRDGKIDGDRISFTIPKPFEIKTPEDNVVLVVQGAAKGDQIDFVMQTPRWGMHDGGVYKFAARRKPR
jgi:hypothetical protein